jgi:hypothetical protein
VKVQYLDVISAKSQYQVEILKAQMVSFIMQIFLICSPVVERQPGKQFPGALYPLNLGSAR